MMISERLNKKFYKQNRSPTPSTHLNRSDLWFVW